MKIKLTSLVLCSSILSSYAFAHAEHDRARFVSSNGQDKGKCDTPVRPCQSIAYAATQAKKGDRILVSSGQYSIKNSDELLALTSDIVPVMGGFNRFDHFLNQAPTLHTTTLFGVPEEYAIKLHNRGFHVIQDGIARNKAEFAQLKQNEIELQQAHQQTQCINNKAGTFSCKNIDLVSHLPLSSFSKRVSAGNDIWGHVDLNDNTEYALMGFNNGVAVVSLKDPANPVEVGFINGTTTAWRDIKVYQYFSEAQNRWLAYAYVTSESGQDGIMVLDLSNLPDKVNLVANDFASARAHNVYISNVDYALNVSLNGQTPTLHLVGENVGGGAYRNFSLSNPATLTSASPTRNTNRSDYTHDAVSFWVKDERATRDCGNTAQAGCEVFVDFNEQEVRLWDITNKSEHQELSSVTYPLARYIHSGWWSEDKKYLFVHDELDEQDHSLKTTVRVFDVSNLSDPVLVKEWEGPTNAIDHNGFVKGNRYYMSNYQRGLTVLDISDPRNPIEAGYFDTFPNSDGAQFNGAWGTYPYLPSGLILVSDINSGLYVLRDNTKNTSSGSLSLPKQAIDLAGEQSSAVIEVLRASGGSGKVSVQYDMLAGNTRASEVVLQQGTLTWEDGDSLSKSITVPIVQDSTTSNKSFFVRLSNVEGDATLDTNIVRVNFGQKPVKVGYADFTQTSLRILENGEEIAIDVHRLNGDEQELTVNYAFENGAASDIDGTLSGQLTWAAGDTATKQIKFKTINDSITESDETFTLTLTGQNLGSNSTLLVQILDDESNVAPVIYLSQSFEANTRQLFTITANVADANNDGLSLLWTQTGGSDVALSGQATRSITFQTPDAAGELTFSLSAQDERGAITEQTVSVKVVEPTTTPPPPTTTPTSEPSKSSSSGGSLAFLLVALVTLMRRRF